MTMDHQILKYKIIVKLLPKNQPEVFWASEYTLPSYATRQSTGRKNKKNYSE